MVRDVQVTQDREWIVVIGKRESISMSDEEYGLKGVVNPFEIRGTKYRCVRNVFLIVILATTAYGINKSNLMWYAYVFHS